MPVLPKDQGPDQRDDRADQKTGISYISSSAWNLYDLLLDFLDLNQIPHGPLLLRDVGIDENKFIKTGYEHKLEKLEQLLQFYLANRFILIDDSGQKDPLLYTEAVRRYRGRILAIYSRDVHPANRARTLAGVRQAQACPCGWSTTPPRRPSTPPSAG